MPTASRSDADLPVRPALTRSAQDLLDPGERALHRIDGGTYGVCESCGKPIGKARLLAFPQPTLCVEGKQRQERR
jgi:DnaK suppressor protein